MQRFLKFEGVKGYSTYERSKKKLEKEVPSDEFVTTLVAVSPEGRFIPVALGEKAAQLGLHFCGICVAN